MSTPFEYGAGFQNGDAFVQDGDGELMIRLNKTVAQPAVVAGQAFVIWNEAISTVAAAAYMKFGNTSFQPSAPGYYRFTGTIAVAAVVGTWTCDLCLVDNLGNPITPGRYRLIAGLDGDDNKEFPFSVVVPITPQSYGLPSVGILINAPGGANIDISTTDFFKTYVDVEELAMQVTAVKTTL